MPVSAGGGGGRLATRPSSLPLPRPADLIPPPAVPAELATPPGPARPAPRPGPRPSSVSPGQGAGPGLHNKPGQHKFVRLLDHNIQHSNILYKKAGAPIIMILL